MNAKERLERIAAQHTDLNVFALIVAMLESGAVSIDCYSDAQVIIKRAMKAQQNCLTRYDLFSAKLLTDGESGIRGG